MRQQSPMRVFQPPVFFEFALSTRADIAYLKPRPADSVSFRDMSRVVPVTSTWPNSPAMSHPNNIDHALTSQWELRVANHTVRTVGDLVL